VSKARALPRQALKWSVARFLEEWVAAGLEPESFWEQTPRSFIVVMRGIAERDTPSDGPDRRAGVVEREFQRRRREAEAAETLSRPAEAQAAADGRGNPRGLPRIPGAWRADHHPPRQPDNSNNAEEE
jgi:hypothetical protein